MCIMVYNVNQSVKYFNMKTLDEDSNVGMLQ